MSLEVNKLHNCFSGLIDPRTETHSSRHLLSDIMMLTILAVICGAESWVAVERFGESKYDWLKMILHLPHGIPSHDTIGSFFSKLDPHQLQRCFLNWINEVFDISEGEIIAIDGKTLRHSYDTARNKPAIHMVNAWACKNNLVLGQFKTKEKSNEITAIPELLKILDIKGHTVTIDAMGCQTAIAKQIIEQEGDYVLNLKGNHKSLFEDVSLFISSHIDKGTNRDTEFNYSEIVTGDHGRIETRRYWVTDKIGWLSQKKDWLGLKSIGMVEYEYIVKATGEINCERRFFISSLNANANTIGQAIRMHWGVENGLHWCLDVGFNEDACHVRKDNAPENFAVIRQIALNLLKQEKTAKTGIKTKRLMAGWDHAYLAKLLKPCQSE
jgi:predicted transposase YbfD/YdcC